MDLYLDRALILFPLLPPVPIHSSLAIHMELLARLVIEHWEDRTVVSVTTRSGPYLKVVCKHTIKSTCHIGSQHAWSCETLPSSLGAQSRQQTRSLLKRRSFSCARRGMLKRTNTRLSNHMISWGHHSNVFQTPETQPLPSCSGTCCTPVPCVDNEQLAPITLVAATVSSGMWVHGLPSARVPGCERPMRNSVEHRIT